MLVRIGARQYNGVSDIRLPASPPFYKSIAKP